MNFVLLQSYDNYVSAHIARGQLEENDINCWLKDENTVTIDPMLSTAVGGIKLMVAEAQVQRATAILNDTKQQQKAAISCPECGSHDSELVSTPRKASNWLSVFWGLLTFSYAMPVDKVYHCFNCDHEFEIKE